MKAFDLRPRRGGDVTQEDLRRELGLNVGTLTDIERGVVGIDTDTYGVILSAIDRVRERKLRGEEVIAA